MLRLVSSSSAFRLGPKLTAFSAAAAEASGRQVHNSTIISNQKIYIILQHQTCIFHHLLIVEYRPSRTMAVSSHPPPLASPSSSPPGRGCTKVRDFQCDLAIKGPKNFFSTSPFSYPEKSFLTSSPPGRMAFIFSVYFARKALLQKGKKVFFVQKLKMPLHATTFDV